MVNLGKAFSIAVVFVLTLALLAVPALAPPVVSADPFVEADLPNPLTVNFTATVVPGDNITFPVQINDTYGTIVNQFSRDPMLLNNTNWNFTTNRGRFFNLTTTTSGSIAGGNLTGDIDFLWTRLDFNVSYDGSPCYVTDPDGVGMLFINATMTNTELGNLTIIGAADLDYNSTIVKGEGQVYTVEPWDEGLVHAPSRVLIGEMRYEISGGTITGAFNLRHYSQNPVGLEGKVDSTQEWLTLEGPLSDEKTEKDDIAIAPGNVTSFMQFTKAPVTTTNVTGFRVCMEDCPPGKEVPQNITGGDVGVNGSISLQRTGVLDVFAFDIPQHLDLPVLSVVATRTTEDNYNSSDSGKWGMAYTIVLVDMTNFTPLPDLGIDQRAYTMMPGYSPEYSGEGYYEGIESYVIAATHIDMHLYLKGLDYRYRLLPTPLVSTVNPTEQACGNTTDVTINGKWFKTNKTYNPLTIDFGSGIEINYYTPVNDTQVIANITVNNTAFVGARDVKVTKRGVTGTKPGGFSVSGDTGNLTGQVDFWRTAKAPCSTWVTPLVVEFYDNATGTPLLTKNVITDVNGAFTIFGVGADTALDIGIKNWTCLSKMKMNVTINASETKVVSFGTPVEGDCYHVGMSSYDIVTFKDYLDVLKNYRKDYWQADFNRNGIVDFKEYLEILKHYRDRGDISVYTTP